MDEIGPVDYAIVAFPGNRFRGEIGPAHLHRGRKKKVS